MVSVRFAVQLWGNEVDVVIMLAELCEELGFDAVYYGDGPFPWLADCMPTLAYIAAKTRRVRIGPVVTYLLRGVKEPYLIAKSFATLDRISKGRVDVRFGAGVDDAKTYWESTGIIYPCAQERVEMLEEALPVVKRLLSGETVNFSGRFFRLREAKVTPSPYQQRIPIHVAAMKKRMLSIAAKHADVCELSFVTLDQLNYYRDLLNKFLPTERNLELSLEIDVVIAPTLDTLSRIYREYLRIRKVDEEHRVVRSAIIGTPSQCVKQVERYVDAGISRFTLTFNEIPDTRGLELFASEVIPCFR